MKKIEQAQKHLVDRSINGWLLYDFHGNNPLARRFLQISDDTMTTRRFFYWLPSQGEPVKLLNAIEPYHLDHLPGKKELYSSWQTMEEKLECLLKNKTKVAMEYSPKNAIPYISKVDAGTIDFVRSLGIEVVSSSDFILHFTSVLNQSQMESQKRAATALKEIVEETWQWVRQKKDLDEYQVQKFILEKFEQRSLITDHPPIVAVEAHSADPHFSPSKENASKIRPGNLLLIDLWAKEKGEGAVFGDLTKVAVLASHPTPKQQQIFDIVRGAQKSSIALVRERFGSKKKIEGWEVDEAARSFITKAGYAEFFLHRTGHNIEIDLHGSGTHMDNLEMHDTRPLLPMTCFSVEPGVYLPGEFGVRLESDVLVHADGKVEVTGGEQERLECLIQ